MAYCYFIHGTRGSGKGAFAVHQIRDVLEAENKVATNMTLFLDDLMPSDSYADVIRLPDIPNGQHLHSLGLAYDFNPDDPSTIDPSKEGLLVLDEIKLYLTKSNKEFHEIVNFLVQSRKYGWNILLTGQHKDQAEEVVYKSLTDKLIVCRDEGKFLGSFLKIFSFLNIPFLSPSSHKAYVFNGRSELDDLEETFPYDWRPVKLSYSTAQIFSQDTIFLKDKFIDMRSIFTYLPPAYLSNYHFVNILQNKIDSLLSKGEPMAVSRAQSGMSTGNKLKIGLMLLGVVVYYSFSNPLDNPIIQKITGEEEQLLVSETPNSLDSYSLNSSPSVINQTDIVKNLFNKYDAQLSALTTDSVYGVYAVIDFYSSGSLVERLTSKDFHYHGYSVEVLDLDSVFVSSPNFKQRVKTSMIHGPTNDLTAKTQKTATDLISSTTFF